MRLLICGSRHIGDMAVLERALAWAEIEASEVALVVQGGCRGVDTLADQWARKHLLPSLTVHANWGRYGRAAGPIRNGVMLEVGKPDQVLALLVPGSRGTRDMVRKAEAVGVPVFRFMVGERG